LTSWIRPHTSDGKLAAVDGPGPRTVKAWAEDMRAAGPSTRDDQSRTWDGRVPNTKQKMLEFLAELEETRKAVRSFHPYDNRP
jgi:hypothetical protein